MSIEFVSLSRLWCTVALCALVPIQAVASQITSCSLVENQGNQELLAAVDALSRELNSHPGCQNQSDLRGIIAAQEQLRSSATVLQAAWRDPQVAAADPAAFAASLTSAVQSVDSIGNSLSSSAFLNSRCGREALSSGKVILALNDVVSSLAPLAILAGTLTSSIGVVAPYVVGIVGVTSTLRVLAGMQSQSSPDMLRPEHRQLVLRATCEYSRVHERLRYLSLAQSEQVDAISRELGAKNHALERLLEQNPGLRELQTRHDALMNVQQTQIRFLREQRSRFRPVKESWDRVGSSASARCAVGRALVRRPRQDFPFTAASSVRAAAVGNDGEPLGLALAVYEELETSAIAGLSSASAGLSQDACADLTEGWIGSLESLLAQAESVTAARIARLLEEQSASETYKTWRNQVGAIEADRALLTKMIEFLRAQGRSESAISRAELDQRVRQVRTALFGRRRGFSVGDAFVESWLEHSLSLYRSSHGEFNRAYETLNRESIFALRAEAAGSARTPIRDDLAFLTPQRLAGDESRLRETCRRMENLWLQWLAANDYLDATKAFCQAIQPMLGDDVARGIIDTCVGHPSLDRSRAVLSDVQTLLDDPQRSRSTERAQLIQRKRAELRCAPPAMR